MASRTPAEDSFLASDGLAKDLVHGHAEVLRYMSDVLHAVRELPKLQVLRTQVEQHLDDFGAHFLSLIRRGRLNSAC